MNNKNSLFNLNKIIRRIILSNLFLVFFFHFGFSFPIPVSSSIRRHGERYVSFPLYFLRSSMQLSAPYGA
ncbi:unnamed protein product [Adineta ricciae]|uniref:Uncharacterized protein n=1 Tax=Adineta ricciae TaxID=249248 RepID=A0A815MT87_ADIRI|nr:unnamed protein product [Adineta ricciae]